MFESLIRRLQDRIRYQPTVDIAVEPPIRPRRPVADRKIARAEARIGFPLPPLIRDLYTQVADGGYGPGTGLLPLAGDGWSFVECARRANDPGSAPWPSRLVEVVSWGCLYTSCVDCSRPSCPVFFYDFDHNTENAPREDYLYPEAESLEIWLTNWLDGVDLWETGPKRSRQV